MFKQDVKDCFVFSVLIPVDDVGFSALKMGVNEGFVDSDDILFPDVIDPFFFDKSFKQFDEFFLDRQDVFVAFVMGLVDFLLFIHEFIIAYQGPSIPV